MGGPGGCKTGGDGPWPCHIQSSSPPSLCATQSEEHNRRERFEHLRLRSVVSLAPFMNEPLHAVGSFSVPSEVGCVFQKGR